VGTQVKGVQIITLQKHQLVWPRVRGHALVAGRAHERHCTRLVITQYHSPSGLNTRFQALLYASKIFLDVKPAAPQVGQPTFACKFDMTAR